ncbi:MAG: DNA-3-methyladenine glycosylase [Candidatus Aminicenantes bacterium]
MREGQEAKSSVRLTPESHGSFPMILPVSFYARPTLDVLEDLIGKVLVRAFKGEVTSGIIVEAEAYCGEDDPASFAHRGRTKKSERLYGPPARTFVYLTYGMHHMLNVVTESENFPAAVLIRALEPLEGISLMKARRKTDEIKNLCSGPAKLCQALSVDLAVNDLPVSSSKSPLLIKEGLRKEKRERELLWRPRVGIRQGRERLWRVYLKDSPFVSVK